MKCFAALLLLVLVGLLPMQPLAMQALQQSEIPVCCRAHGVHRCAMLVAVQSTVARTDSWTSAPCSNFQLHPVALSTTVFITEDADYGVSPSHTFFTARNTSTAAFEMLNLQRTPRGPPLQ